ncbi:MAG: hypothetical protein ACI9OU_002047 [Candidatus Promineifilaceae bacterium]|jgi:hypothetical protein
MKLKQLVVGFWLSVVVCFSATALHAQTEDFPLVNIGGIMLGVHGSDTQTRGMADAVLPLWHNEDALVFLNPRVSFNDDHEEEFNIGLAVRKLVADGQLIVGVNGFYDSRSSTHNNRFEQVGGGIELLSSWVDVRANFYYPDDEQKVISSRETTEVSSTRRASTGAPYVSGTAILQDRTTVTRTTTTARLFEEFEAALEGFDAEIGVRVPVFEEHVTTRVFVGYQDFDNPFGDDKEGVKGRIEIQLGDGFLVDAEVFENEDLNHTEFFVGVRVRVPFSIANLIAGKNPFEGTRDAFRPRPSVLSSRLGEMVIRDMNIRLGGSTEMENVGSTSSSTRETSRTETDVIGVVPPPPPPPPIFDEEAQ